MRIVQVLAIIVSAIMVPGDIEHASYFWLLFDGAVIACASLLLITD